MSETTVSALAALRHAPWLGLYATAVLPFWFLLLALFVPRVALFLGWLEAFRFPLPFPVDVVFWLLFFIFMVIILIYTRQGIDIWFVLHAIAALLVYTGGSHQVITRRR